MAVRRPLAGHSKNVPPRVRPPAKAMAALQAAGPRTAISPVMALAQAEGDRERIRHRLIQRTQFMRAMELARGFDPIELDAKPWFRSADWEENSFLSVRRRHVRIVLLEARRPGTGAFSQLLRDIAQAGYTLEVALPLGHMEDILKRWGWRKHRVGSGETAHDVWRPKYSVMQKLRQIT